jgi:hypothetical protein
MDEQTIRRIMHIKRKDKHKVDALQLLYELEQEKKGNKYCKTLNLCLIILLLFGFIAGITYIEAKKISVGEEALKLLKQHGKVEK